MEDLVIELNEFSGIKIGDVVKHRTEPRTLRRILRIWQMPDRHKGKTFCSMQAITKQGEPDKRFWDVFSGGEIEQWEIA